MKLIVLVGVVLCALLPLSHGHRYYYKTTDSGEQIVPDEPERNTIPAVDSPAPAQPQQVTVVFMSPATSQDGSASAEGRQGRGRGPRWSDSGDQSTWRRGRGRRWPGKGRGRWRN